MSNHLQNDDKRLLELLDRWQTGNFSRADEQELQALTSSDDFRREAVEGFFSLPEADHRVNLEAIRSRLRPAARHVAWPRILAAAAAVAILISAAVWLIPRQESATAPLAQQAPPPPLENTSDAAPQASQNTPSVAGPSPERRITADPQEQPESPATFHSTPINTATETAGAAAQAESESAAEIAAPVTRPADDEAQYAKVEDALEDVDVAPGNMARPAKEKTDKNQVQSKASEAMKKRSAPTTGGQPVGGWDDFRQYLRRNARLPEAARQQNISGKVLLRFRLDENDQPFDFQIIRSLGYVCDEEAVRLIKAYRWQRNTTADIQVEVPFVR
ncbi:MAG: energy transducer TonB [Saprospiraceae bacterium]|nr:energy transducer TonB [Saprospiraceae bacterium]